MKDRRRFWHGPPHRDYHCQQPGGKKNDPGPGVGDKVPGGDAEQQTLQKPHGNKRCNDPDAKADSQKQKAPAQHHPADIASLRTECHPDSDLVRLFTYRIGNDAVNSYGCKDKGK